MAINPFVGLSSRGVLRCNQLEDHLDGSLTYSRCRKDQMSSFPFSAAERSAQKSVTLNLLLKQNPFSCCQFILLIDMCRFLCKDSSKYCN